MVYCVIPGEFEGELYEEMTEYYADDPDVAVVIDRRQRSRRRWPRGVISGVRRPVHGRWRPFRLAPRLSNGFG